MDSDLDNAVEAVNKLRNIFRQREKANRQVLSGSYPDVQECLLNFRLGSKQYEHLQELCGFLESAQSNEIIDFFQSRLSLKNQQKLLCLLLVFLHQPEVQ